MQIFEQKKELSQFVNEAKAQGKSIGFVGQLSPEVLTNFESNIRNCFVFL